MCRARYHAARKPLPQNAWVEITHCVPTGRSHREEFGSWMYWAPGSGVWFHLGRTAVFASHVHAVRLLAQRECENYQV